MSQIIKNDVREERMTAHRFSEILERCGLGRDSYPGRVNYRQSRNSMSSDFMVMPDGDVTMDQLVRIKIESDYDLVLIEPKHIATGTLCLTFGHGYKRGAIKRIITEENIGAPNSQKTTYGIYPTK